MKKYFALLLAFSYHAMAQQAPTIQLQDAINTALRNSYDIQLAKNDIKATVINNNYGIAGRLPVVTGSAQDNETITSINQKYSDATRDVTRNNAASNSLGGSIDGSILLYNGMRVVATKKRLETLEQQSRQRLNAQVQNTIASVMSTYYDVVRQQGYIKTIDQSIVVSKQRLTIIETQQSVGMANNADLFQAQIDLNALEQSKEQQLLIIAQAKTELLRLMNVKLDSAINIADTIITDRNIMLDSILSKIPDNPDVLAAQDQVRINELIVRETAAQRYPSISGSGGYQYGRTRNAAGFTLLNQNYGPYVGIGVAIPIYNGSIYKRQQKVAEINTENAGIQQRSLERDYSASVIKNYQAYLSSLQQLEKQQQVFKTAQQLLYIVMQRFQLRVNTIVEVREAQQSFENEGYRLINLSFAAKSAEIELKRLASLLAF